MKVNEKMKKVLCIGLFGLDIVPTLAQAIDRLWDGCAEKRRAKKLAKEEAKVSSVAHVEESESFEELLENLCAECEAAEQVASEPAVEAMAQAETEEDAIEAEDAEESDDELEKGRFGSTTGLAFFDAKAYPEKYAELLEREAKGEVQIVTRYRHGFASRVAQADDEVQEYYSILKNKLLSYKGVRSRMSWTSESFNRGRSYVARLNVKARTLYLYLAMDPAEVAALEDGKYHVEDLSAQKKHANVPVLFKIKGPRKLKYALELIELLCEKQLEIPKLKKFTETDYRRHESSVEALVESGDVKMMVSGVEVGKS